jgi:hypothetical protein
MALFTEADMKEYMPDLHNYGIQDFSDMIAKTDEDIYRLLRVEWYPKLGVSSYNGSYTGDLSNFDTTKLKASQLTRSAVYYCLYKYVLPKLTQWSVEGDSFQTQIKFYRDAFEEEFAIAQRELYYDWDGDGVYEDGEHEIQPAKRLVR